MSTALLCAKSVKAEFLETFKVIDTIQAYGNSSISRHCCSSESLARSFSSCCKERPVAVQPLAQFEKRSGILRIVIGKEKRAARKLTYQNHLYVPAASLRAEVDMGIHQNEGRCRFRLVKENKNSRCFAGSMMSSNYFS